MIDRDVATWSDGKQIQRVYDRNRDIPESRASISLRQDRAGSRWDLYGSEMTGWCREVGERSVPVGGGVLFSIRCKRCNTVSCGARRTE